MIIQLSDDSSPGYSLLYCFSTDMPIAIESTRKGRTQVLKKSPNLTQLNATQPILTPHNLT